MTVLQAISEIKSAGWFYTWLQEQKEEKNDENGKYEGSCPCFYYENESFSLDCDCWHSAGGLFRYSGLHLVDKTKSVNEATLKELALLCMGDITQVWKNTDWEYAINDGEPVEYEILEIEEITEIQKSEKDDADNDITASAVNASTDESFELDQSYLYSKVEVGYLIRSLNHKVMEAGRKENSDEVVRLAGLAGGVEEALKELEKK